MTAFVLDASVTAAWLLPDEASAHTGGCALIRRDRSRAASAEPLVGMREHLANVRRELSSAAIEGLWSVLEAIRHRVELHELAPAQHKASLSVAMDAGLSAYGASYMWLARSLNLPLATFDTGLVAAAPACGVKILDIATL
jgi:predicted nucleic acid-binding protein